MTVTVHCEMNHGSSPPLPPEQPYFGIDFPPTHLDPPYTREYLHIRECMKEFARGESVVCFISEKAVAAKRFLI